MANFDKWVGRVAVVTGASFGSGANIAEQLTKRGLKVVGISQPLYIEHVKAQARKLVGEKGTLYPVQCDVSDRDEVRSTFKWINENLGTVHILINNAGNLKRNERKTIFEVDTLGLLNCSNQAMKVMKDLRIDGHIFNVNSSAGRYSMQLPEKIVSTVTTKSVGVLTNLWRTELRASGFQITITDIIVRGTILPQNIPERPLLTPEDFTNAVIHVLSEPSDIRVQEVIL